LKYQLFSYEKIGVAKTGILVNAHWLDLDAAAQVAGESGLIGRSVDDFLNTWSISQNSLRKIARAVQSDAEAFVNAELDGPSLTLLAPLTRPGVIYCAGANYRDHVEAMSKAFNMRLVLDPKAEGVDPWHFLKPGPATVVGDKAKVAFPGHTKKLDWEAELAVVIGARTRNVSVEKALEMVAGYTCANDLSARDNLVRTAVDPSSPFRFDWIGHKCFAGSCPLGPVLTPAEFVESPETLDISLTINGDIRQNSNTRNHLYSVADQIAYLSTRVELFPGDVILTGTPAGVGMETGTFLQRGDVMKVRIEGLGELETTVV
jgi:2-keto-4-pentenoate hydratase/2-oxohepta-3-ene-1,7-dioic acid hydratase in catechol pathway